jgi:hypothetical protein
MRTSFGFQGLTVLPMKGVVFFDITPCSLVDRYGHSEERSASIFSATVTRHSLILKMEAVYPFERTDWSSGNALDILTENFHGFPQSIQADAGIVSLLYHDRLLPNPFSFNIY